MGHGKARRREADRGEQAGEEEMKRQALDYLGTVIWWVIVIACVAGALFAVVMGLLNPPPLPM